MDIYIPEKIRQYTYGHTFATDSIGMSASTVLIYDSMVLKIEKYSQETDKAVQMIEWLQDKLPVPQIICSCVENGICYTLMSRINGKMTCDEQLMENQDRTVTLMAQGLRMFWEQDITDCPRIISIEDDIAQSRFNLENKLIDEAEVDWFLLNKHHIANLDELMIWLENNKPECQPVLSHGDYCMPNVMVSEKGIEGFIDLGQAAVADMYRDISMCYISLRNNYSGVFGGKIYVDFNPEILFEKLGIIPDYNRLEYYLLLNELFKLK